MIQYANVCEAALAFFITQRRVLSIGPPNGTSTLQLQFPTGLMLLNDRVMQCLQHCPADAEELLNQLYPAIHMSGSRWLIVSGVSSSAVFVSPPRIVANGVDAAVLDATSHRVTVQ